MAWAILDLLLIVYSIVSKISTPKWRAGPTGRPWTKCAPPSEARWRARPPAGRRAPRGPPRAAVDQHGNVVMDEDVTPEKLKPILESIGLKIKKQKTQSTLPRATRRPDLLLVLPYDNSVTENGTESNTKKRAGPARRWRTAGRQEGAREPKASVRNSVTNGICCRSLIDKSLFLSYIDFVTSGVGARFYYIRTRGSSASPYRCRTHW